MICKRCGLEDHGVIDSRYSRGHIRRRRVCKNCKNRWTTYEIAVPEGVQWDDLTVLHNSTIKKRLKSIIKDIEGLFYHE